MEEEQQGKGDVQTVLFLASACLVSKVIEFVQHFGNLLMKFSETKVIKLLLKLQ